jgi:Hydrazine synthase alpha subunit middle domain
MLTCSLGLHLFSAKLFSAKLFSAKLFSAKLFSAKRFLCAVFGLMFLMVACTPQGNSNSATQQPAGSQTTANPILFVTQVPVKDDFTTIASVFGNHRGDLQSVARGGDLWIRYADGSLKNLTKTAGFGVEGFQNAKAIAVRDPSVHWDGQKAIFSMVIGAPEKQYEYKDYFWQLFEVTGLGAKDTPRITKISNQPLEFNNISPIYGTDDRIIFTSDRPRDGARHLYPQRDEYEEAPTVTGLWSLNPTDGNLKLLNHAPSGDFTPSIDSFGRVIFTQWDHLQRDQQADADRGGGANGTFNYSSEATNATRLNTRDEVYPEPRDATQAKGTNLNTHTFNQFFPWMILEDGAESEVVNHLGRHELAAYMPQSFNDDPNLTEYYGQYPRKNPNAIANMLQIKEDPSKPGRYFGVDAPEFYTHASGQIVSLEAGPSVSPDVAQITYVTHRDTAGYTEEGKAVSANHSGHYREPLPLSDGTLIAVHTAETHGTSGSYSGNYDFRLKRLKKSGIVWIADQPLTTGLNKTLSYWNPDQKVEFNGALWELNPVEVRARVRPARRAVRLEVPEQQMFSQAGVELGKLQTWLVQNNLAVAVARNVTTRDDLDKQQPFNLQVPGGVKTVGGAGKVYDVAHLQFFQADLIRGIGGSTTPRDGRRVLAQVLHDQNAIAQNPVNPGGPAGSVTVATDGSIAAFVPARRAMSWQLTDSSGTGVVRERYWLTFQPGEVRVCGSCHGLSDKDQAGNGVPTNPPQALLKLLQAWKIKNP